MKLFTLLLILIASSFNLMAQSYTNPSGSNSGSQNIYNVTFQGINNSTSSEVSDFYHDYTGLTNSGTAANPGGSFNLSVSTYNQFPGDIDTLRVWIDWNEDNSFDDAFEVPYSASKTTVATNELHTFNTTINVPSSVPNWSGASGQFRMRIGYAWNGEGVPLSPSGSGYTDAEFEDYVVKLSVSTLPIKLNSFTANADENNIRLKWTTATELNNSGFEVQRSIAPENLKTGTETWENAGFVKGAGNSNISNNYEFVDKNLFAGKYLYRLKQIDFDGHFEYSNIVEATILSTHLSLSQNFPNPANGNTTIRYSLPAKAHVSLKIFNTLGKEIGELVNEVKDAGTYTATFNAGNLPAGAYFYTLTAGKDHQTKKMILLR